jgi:hypothetical protein
MKSIIWIILIGAFAQIETQQEQFDIIGYNAPKGWQKELTNHSISYFKSNQKTNGWSRITLYKCNKSLGSAVNDFANEWNNIVIKNYPGSTFPVPLTQVKEGWTRKTGSSKVKLQNKNATIQLTTISSNGLVVSILIQSNSLEFKVEEEAFIESISILLPD